MPTMNVSLPEKLTEFIESEVRSGEYGTASEVVRDGLRLLQREKAVREEKLAVLRREVGIGVEQARARRFSKRSVEEIAGSVRKAGERRK